MILWLKNISVIRADGKTGHRHKSLRKFIFLMLVLKVFLVRAAIGGDLLGIVSAGEVGQLDAGKLVRINPYNGAVTEIGFTGLTTATALAYDPVNRRLIAGTGSGEIYEINPETAEATKIVRRLLPDPSPPSWIVFLGLSPWNALSSLDFHPTTNELYAVVGDGLSEYLARLDLDAIDDSKQLTIDLVDVIGSTNYAYQGDGLSAPFGFINVMAIGFNPMNGELYGAGIKLPQTLPNPYLIKLQTSANISPFVQAVGGPAENIRSFVRAGAFNPETGRNSWAGLILADNSQLQNVLFEFELVSGAATILGQINVSGQISGLAYVPVIPDSLAERPPSIIGSQPQGGNAGIIVTIRGEAFTANGVPIVTGVEFNGITSLTDPVVISDSIVRATVPNTQTGPIRVITVAGEATSAFSFQWADLLVLDVEASQGIPRYPLVAGKDTLLRLFTASSLGNSTWPVTYETALLTIITPNGISNTCQPEVYTRIFTNRPDSIVTDARHNINFYVDGNAISEPGNYVFHFDVRAPSGDPGVPGPVIYSYDLPKEVKSTPGALRLLVVLGGILDGDEWTGPDEGSMDGIAKVFSELSRVHPVRNGIGRLGQDSYAGVRFEFTPEAIPLSRPSNPKIVLEDYQGALESLLDDYNEENQDDAEYIAVYIGDEHILLRAGSFDPVANGAAIQKGRVSVARVPDASMTNLSISNTALHELGHNMHRVGENSPNYDEEDDKNHSKNLEFPPGANHLEIRAFDIPRRTSLSESALDQPNGPSRLPVSIMYKRGNKYKQLDGRIFFEEFEYKKLLNSDLYGNAVGPAVTPIWNMPAFPEPMASQNKLFTVIAEISENSPINFLQSYVSAANKRITKTDPQSPFELVFLNSSSEVLAKDPIAVPFDIRTEGESSVLSKGVLQAVRPFPESTEQVQVRWRGQILTWIRKPSNPPVVSIVSPGGNRIYRLGELVYIKWTARTPGEAKLRFNVTYSPDGIRWLPIAAGISETHWKWRTSLSPGSKNGRIRVMASDGFNTANSVIEGLLVDDKPPRVSILYPESEKKFLEFDYVPLEVLAFDLEKGMLDGELIQWFSNRSGYLGFGRRLRLLPGTLKPGKHTLKITATDKIHKVSKTISIEILADRDRDALPDDWEKVFRSQNPTYPYDNAQDLDKDALSSLEEYRAQTDSEDSDTDNDGFSDGKEIISGTDPNNDNSPKWETIYSRMDYLKVALSNWKSWIAIILLVLMIFFIGRRLRF